MVLNIAIWQTAFGRLVPIIKNFGCIARGHAPLRSRCGHPTLVQFTESKSKGMKAFLMLYYWTPVAYLILHEVFPVVIDSEPFHMTNPRWDHGCVDFYRCKQQPVAKTIAYEKETQ